MAGQKDTREMSGKCNSTTTDTSVSFLDLPGELRNRIYELILLHHEPIDPRADSDRQQKFTPGLLRAHKAVHGEAGPLFYGQNRFDFNLAALDETASFLEQIGCNNAGYIRHIFINFPIFISLDPGDITLEEDSISILATIQSGCANWSTLTTSLYSTDVVESRLNDVDNAVAIEALKLVDTHFSAISSLQEIILEMYENDDPRPYIRRSDDIRRRMKSYGWTINTTEKGAMVSPATAPWGLSISDADFEKLKAGFEPRDMDDKWRILVADSDESGITIITISRSWTGHKHYKLHVRSSDGSGSVKVESMTWEQNKGGIHISEEQGKKEAVLLCRGWLDCDFDQFPYHDISLLQVQPIVQINMN